MRRVWPPKPPWWVGGGGLLQYSTKTPQYKIIQYIRGDRGGGPPDGGAEILPRADGLVERERLAEGSQVAGPEADTRRWMGSQRLHNWMRVGEWINRKKMQAIWMIQNFKPESHVNAWRHRRWQSKWWLAALEAVSRQGRECERWERVPYEDRSVETAQAISWRGVRVRGEKWLLEP